MGKMDAFAPEGTTPRAPGGADQLRSYVDRVRRLKEEIKARNADIADLYGAASSDGWDKRVLKVLVKRLDSDADELENLDNLLHLYETTYRNEAAAGSSRSRLDA